MINNSNQQLVVLIALISDIYSQFLTWFINIYFWDFENTTLEFSAIPIIYLFLFMLYVSSLLILYSAFLD